MSATCKTCKFLVPGERKTMDLSVPVKASCYRMPPSSSAFIAPGVHGEAVILTVTSRPEVDDGTLACGEYAIRLSSVS